MIGSKLVEIVGRVEGGGIEFSLFDQVVGCWAQWRLLLQLIAIVLQMFFLLTNCKYHPRRISRNVILDDNYHPPVHLIREAQNVVLDNGIVNVTLSVPQGLVTGISYNGIEILEACNSEHDRGYWDIIWNKPGYSSIDYLSGTRFQVIMQNESQIEVSFTRRWNFSHTNTTAPLNVDKRFIMLRGSSGFYMYTILERLEGWPGFEIEEARIVFKLRQSKFHYMAMSDERQRIMPMAMDRVNGQVLAYKEAVLLTNPINPDLKGEVDDKYFYSNDSKDARVHGWICTEPPVGFWMIIPSNEFRTGGPLKQELTAHVGPIILSPFISRHYAGKDLSLEFKDGEPWKKVFGPVFVYLNTHNDSARDSISTLWNDAKEKMVRETVSWPYSFPLSKDFLKSNQRGSVRGRLLVLDRYIAKEAASASGAYVGLAAPGAAGSWQRESKGYQFWTRTDSEGHFLIKDVLPGNYSLYSWVPGTLGDYKHAAKIRIISGKRKKLHRLVYEPPRTGATLWEIGVPDRSAAEFYIPNPSPSFKSHLYKKPIDKFRQYGLWERYSDLYPVNDLVYTVGKSDFRTDWFFAHVNRYLQNRTYKATTWTIIFNLENVTISGAYTLQLALASVSFTELQVRFNDPNVHPPHFTTTSIGSDNAIARHGIHGLYWLFSIGVPRNQLFKGSNFIFLTLSGGSEPFHGVMYDYIRLEMPPEVD